METIVFIGASKSGSSQEGIEAAERLGYFTVLLTNNRNFLEQRVEFPHVHEMIYTEIENMAEITSTLESLRQQGKNIVAVVSSIDPYVHTAAVVGRELGLPHQSEAAIATMLNKISMRRLLKDTAYSPYFTAQVSIFLKNHLPLVVKCPRSNGSKDVLLARTSAELNAHIRHLTKRYPHEPVLFEEYMDGKQYLTEVLVHEREPKIVAIVEQTITQERRFIVTAYKIRPTLPQDFVDNVSEMVRTVVEYTGMDYGAFHIEFRVVNGQSKIIEVNPRISGSSMNRMIRLAFGINLVEETLKSQLRLVPDTEREYERHVFAQYLTVKEEGILARVTGRNQARRVPGVAEVYVKPRVGTLLHPAVSMGHRYAYVIGVADKESEAEFAAKTAAGMIEFHVISKTKGTTAR